MIEYLFLAIAIFLLARAIWDMPLINIKGTGVTVNTVFIEFLLAAIFLLLFIMIYLRKRKNKEKK